MREPARWVAHVAAVLQPPLVEAARRGCGLAMGVKAHPRIARGCDGADARSERFEAVHTEIAGRVRTHGGGTGSFPKSGRGWQSDAVSDEGARRGAAHLSKSAALIHEPAGKYCA